MSSHTVVLCEKTGLLSRVIQGPYPMAAACRLKGAAPENNSKVAPLLIGMALMNKNRNNKERNVLREREKERAGGREVCSYLRICFFFFFVYTCRAILSRTSN